MKPKHKRLYVRRLREQANKQEAPKAAVIVEEVKAPEPTTEELSIDKTVVTEDEEVETAKKVAKKPAKKPTRKRRSRKTSVKE